MAAGSIWDGLRPVLSIIVEREHGEPSRRSTLVTEVGSYKGEGAVMRRTHSRVMRVEGQRFAVRVVVVRRRVVTIEEERERVQAAKMCESALRRLRASRCERYPQESEEAAWVPALILAEAANCARLLSSSIGRAPYTSPFTGRSEGGA